MKGKIVDKPVLEFNFKDGRTIRLWVLNPGQMCRISSARCHEFTAIKTASLIYESLGHGSHDAVEYNLDEASIWEWISRYMKEGFSTLLTLY